MKFNSTRNKFNKINQSTIKNTIDIEKVANIDDKLLQVGANKYPSFVLYDSGWVYYKYSAVMGG